MVQTYRRKAIMTWNGRPLTDHNRSEVAVDVERIQTEKRMANGTMRKYVVADKHTFTVSWENLPDGRAILDENGVVTGYEVQTVDGGMGGSEMEQMYLNGAPIIMELHPFDPEYATPEENPRYRSYRVFITDFSKDITRRGPNLDFWNVNVTLEEV